jgi:hypothetical protein
MRNIDLPEVNAGDHSTLLFHLFERGFKMNSDGEFEAPLMHPMLHRHWWDAFILCAHYHGHKDLTRVCAAVQYKVPFDAVTDEQREWAKRQLFGTFYGRPFTLSYMISELVQTYVEATLLLARVARAGGEDE